MAKDAARPSGSVPPAAGPARVTSVREVVRQFTPNWFTVTMGTGILALALHQLPFDWAGQYRVAEALWFLNIGLFALFSVIYAARWLFFFHEAKRIFDHSVVSMFFGAFRWALPPSSMAFWRSAFNVGDRSPSL